MKIYSIPLTKNVTSYFCHSSLKPAGAIFTFAEKGKKKWAEFSQAEDGSYKKKIYNWGMGILDKIDYQECFLKRVPPLVNGSSNEMLTILHPSFLESSKVKNDLISLVEKRVKFHRKYMYLNALALPFTGIISILPIPNIPFFYFAFRLYSHYRAYSGGSHIQYIFKK